MKRFICFFSPLAVFVILTLSGFSQHCHASAYPVNFRDSDNNLILVTRPFSRIISLYPAHTENLVALGAGSLLVGVSRSPKPVKGIPSGCKDVSYRDDLERLIALRPDLVIIRPMITRSHPNLVTGLKRNNITVVSLQPVSIAELYSYWRTLGLLAGRQKQDGRPGVLHDAGNDRNQAGEDDRQPPGALSNPFQHGLNQTVDKACPVQAVADEAWAVYKQRNDSFVVDLLQGQYKSKLVCPVCNKVSVQKQ